MNSYYFWFVIFFITSYFIITDKSIASTFYYVTQIAVSKYLIFQWWLIHNPKTPWARYSIHRRSMKIAKELMKEFENKNN